MQLAERLLAIAPRQPDRAPLAKVFYADNGSAGVEVALKMAFHYFHNRDEHRRTRFIALENGYHGETIGALSVGDIPLYRRVYAPLLLESIFAPSPDAYLAEPGQSAEDYALQAADALQHLLEQSPGEICALILEPRVQCAGGMRMYHPAYLRRARELCDAHGVFLIADEIATGFGRTGTLFACEQAGVMPDLLCLSKGLTGGFLPLSAVLATQQLYDAFLDDSRERAFLHSHSYTGNPLACAAALATLLRHHYDLDVDETTAFRGMWTRGDQAQIRRLGFSLLDMQRFLKSRGYTADGFQLPLDKLIEAKLPAIVLISDKGYHHFVVVKGAEDGRILLGDPSRGTRTIPRERWKPLTASTDFAPSLPSAPPVSKPRAISRRWISDRSA